MPSKNSINKPKENMKRQRKSLSASKRRAVRARQSVTVVKQSDGSTAIVPLNSNKIGSGVIANTVLSNKKAKKLERNLKYAKLRRDGMLPKTESEPVVENEFRKALWTVVESPVVLRQGGEGTTLGGAEY